MARAIPDGICRGTGPRLLRQGAKESHAAGPARMSKRGDRGRDIAALGKPHACHVRSATIELQSTQGGCAGLKTASAERFTRF
jgi:hypothetical protein